MKSLTQIEIQRISVDRKAAPGVAYIDVDGNVWTGTHAGTLVQTASPVEIEKITPLSKGQTVFFLKNSLNSSMVSQVLVNSQEQIRDRDYSIKQNQLFWISKDFTLDPGDTIILRH